VKAGITVSPGGSPPQSVEQDSVESLNDKR